MGLGCLFNLLSPNCLASPLHLQVNHETEMDGSHQRQDVIVRFNDNLLTVLAQDVRLETVLAVISRQTGVSISFRGSTETLASVRISEQSLENTIKRLCCKCGYVFVYEETAAENPFPNLSSIYVISDSPTSERVPHGAIAGTSEAGPNSSVSETANHSGMAFGKLRDEAFEGDDKALSQMIQLALYEEKEDIRAASIEALGAIGEERVMNALIKGLDDSEAWVRAANLRAIGNHGGERALHALEVALQDPVPEVRETAKLIMAELKNGERE
jgi:hypothetical protein